MAAPSLLARAASGLDRFSRRWVPSSFTIAWILTLIALLLAMTWARASFLDCARAWGDGFWELLSFSMQMCLIVFTGSIIAVSPSVSRFLSWLASRPRTPKQAVFLMAFASMTMALLHWGVSIVAGAVLIRELGRRRIGVDFRLLVAAAYLGLGLTWHAGLSGSAPLLVATPGHFLEKDFGLIPMAQTTFSTFNLVLVGIVVVLFSFLTPLLHPSREETVEAGKEQLDAIQVFAPPARAAGAEARSPAVRLDQSRAVNLTFGGLALLWLWTYLARPGHSMTLNTLNFCMLALGVALHPSVASLTRAAEDAGRLTFGIILQFPVYSGIYGIIKGTGLAEAAAHTFTTLATPATYPAIVFWYSGIVNYFIPSGGSKWPVEAPYILGAAKALGVPLSKTVVAYAWGDMVTNIIQPFWAIPLLAAARLDFREILRFCFLIFCVYLPLVSLAFLLFPR